MKQYTPWYEQRLYKDRFITEVESLKNQFGFILDQDQRDKFQRIVLHGEVIINEKYYPLHIIYPPAFPQFRINVFSPGTTLARHQNWKDKNLCLLPHGQEGWEENYTGVDMVKQAIQLIKDSEAGAQIVAEKEVDAPEPWSSFVPFGPYNLIFPTGLPCTIPPGCFGEFSVSQISNTTFVLDKMVNQHDKYKQTYSIEPISIFIPKKQFKRGLWVKVSSNPPSLNPRELATWLIQQAPETKNRLLGLSLGIKTKQGIPDLIGIVFPEENCERNNFRDSWLVAFTKNFVWLRPHYIDRDIWFERNPKLRGLCNKKVIILGLGSLGSAIALELTKAGVGSLVLVDRDHIEAGNLTRHIANMYSLGIHKIQAVADAVRLQNPFITVEGIDTSVGMLNDFSLKQMDSLNDVYQKMSECDLMIDSMAHEGATHLVSRMSVDLNIPIIHTWVTNGAWAGRIIRTIPGKTGCYYCLCKQGVTDISSDMTTGEIFPRGCGFPTFTGASFDILAIASAATRLTVQTLLNGHSYSYPEYDHIVFENQGIPFNAYPAVRVFQIERDNQCPICGDQSGS